jgi:hypothetical protein
VRFDDGSNPLPADGHGINTPSFEAIEALAAALETSVTDLFTFPGQENERQRVRMVSQKIQAELPGRNVLRDLRHGRTQSVAEQ